MRWGAPPPASRPPSSLPPLVGKRWQRGQAGRKYPLTSPALSDMSTAMPLPIIADTYRVAFRWTGPNGAHAVNVMHFLQSSTTAAAVANTIDANVTANMWRSTTTGVICQDITVTPLDGSSASFVHVNTGAKWAGPGSGDVIPAMAFLIKCQTLFRGRNRRGRIFLPFVNEAGQSNGVLTPADVTAGQTAWNTFLTAMVAAGLQPVVASYVLSSQVPISSYVYEGIAATMRPRQSRLR
jgi:hypothetical protein